MRPADSDTGDGGSLRLRLDLAYDGRDFSGWAAQPGRRTVQGVVETALATILRMDPPPATTVAGRTDAGVHARGQVCHVDVPADAWAGVPGRSDRSPGVAMVRRLAGVLPADVRVRSVVAAPPGFDARFSAIWRRYAYRVADEPSGVDPLLRGHVLHYGHALDVEAMNAAAANLLGEHDFAAYCRPRDGATTIRELQRLSVERRTDGVLEATIRADAFCHNQVRAMVGALLAVGSGRRPTTWPADVLAAGVRDSAVTVVAAHGLTLEEVGYPPDPDLARQAASARRRRVLSANDPST